MPVKCALDIQTGWCLATTPWHPGGDLLELPAGQRTQQDQERVGSIMRRLGFERKLRRVRGHPVRCYVREGNSRATDPETARTPRNSAGSRTAGIGHLRCGGWVGVQAVSSEPVSAEFPVEQGKNREF